MNTRQGESKSLPQPHSALLLGLMPTAASPRSKAECGLSSRNPPCSGSPHQRPALIHPQLSSLLGLAASAASPYPPAIILPARARRISGQPLSTRNYPPCSGSPHQRPALIHPQLSSLLGLAASAASPSPPAIILPARARRISGQP